MRVHLHTWNIDLLQLKTTKMLKIVEVNCGHDKATSSLYQMN